MRNIFTVALEAFFIVRRFRELSKTTMKVVKGVTAGVAIGLIAGYLGKNMTEDKKHMKKKANRAVETMADLMDTVGYMFR